MGTYLTHIISDIGFADVIDVVIISYVVYQLLKFIRRSRAIQLAKGLLILIIASFAASAFNLFTLKWILNRLLDVGFIALVVIFQPELRRGLEFLGRGKFSSKSSLFDRERLKGAVDVLVRSIESFAAQKIGALIVIERETALTDIAETGIILDADLTEQLVENIFYQGAPLHDGAMIIRNDRILAVGCVLPLTENKGLSKDLGTRHRAALGITEISDALVLIVSEETGIISTAIDGKLSRFLDLKTVEKTLLNEYMESFNRSEGIFSWPINLFGKDENE